MKLSFWRVNPLVRPALLFIAGIKSSEIIFFEYPSSIFMLICSLLLCSYTIRKISRAEQFQVHRLSSIFLLVSIFFSGILISKHKAEETDQCFISNHLLERDLLIKVMISGYPRISKSGVVKFDANLIAIKDQNSWIAMPAKLKCNSLQKDDLNIVMAGDHYILKTQINLPKPSSPDSEFDYRSWLLLNGYGGTINFSQQRLFVSSDLLYTKRLSSDLQKHILNYINVSEFSDKSKQLAPALLLGDKINLDEELKVSFSNSGIIHLLAVSGLHVGLIYQLFTFLFSILFGSHKNMVIKFFMTLLILWSYAFITGLSPSVCRASTMLSLSSLAIFLKCHKQPFNTLFGAVIILLCINPTMINDIGFLLSFMAVLGILSIAPYSQKINRIEVKPLRWVLLSMLISTSAQLATAPLSLYVFGKFPTYFMLSNLFAIPLASIITFTGFLALCLQFIPYLGELFLTLCMLSIELLINLSELIASFPHATVLFHDFSAQTAILLLFIILFLFSLHQTSKLMRIKLVLVFSLGYSLFRCYSEQTRTPPSLKLYGRIMGNHTFFGYYSGRNKIWQTMVSPTKKENVNRNESILCVIENKGFFILKDGMKLIAPPITCKWFIHTQTSDLKLIGKWIDALHPTFISIDSSIDVSEKNIIADFCTQKGISIWNWDTCNILKI